MKFKAQNFAVCTKICIVLYQNNFAFRLIKLFLYFIGTFLLALKIEDLSKKSVRIDYSITKNSIIFLILNKLKVQRYD